MATVEVDLKNAIQYFLKYSIGSIQKTVDEQTRKKQTPYACYKKLEHKRLEQEIPDGLERTKVISESWNKIKNDKEKCKIYKEQSEKVCDPKEKRGRVAGLNSYTFYCKIIRQIEKEENGNQKTSNNKIISVQWKELTDVEKKKYKDAVDLYNIDNNNYEKLYYELK